MKFLSLFIIFFATTSFAQQFNFRPSGISGSAGFGFTDFKVNDPTAQDFKMKNGVYTTLGGEKGFDFANLYLTFSLNYLKSSGDSKYGYTKVNGDYYASTNTVPFDVDLFQAGLGLKLKLIDNYWFRPYVEAGGLFGYFQLKYKDLANRLTTKPNNDYKTSDSLMDFGYYGEAGIEISFSQTFGLKLAARETRNETKQFETLEKNRVNYNSQIYYLSLLRNF